MTTWLYRLMSLMPQVYDMIEQDFFKNGSLTSRSKVPELMAAIWTGGCEVSASLEKWHGEQMPLSRSWVDAEIEGLEGEEEAIARLAIVLAKAPYQVDEKMAEAVLGSEADEARFVRILAWASFTGARRFVQLVAARTVLETAAETLPLLESGGQRPEALAA